MAVPFWVTWLPAQQEGAKAPFECGRGGGRRINKKENKHSVIGVDFELTCVESP